MSIFDKSFIHSINAEEAAVFDMHFLSNITPLFFIEVLADLEKSGLSSEQRAILVKSLAGKTPVFQSYPNVPHPRLVRTELAGFPIEMRGVPAVGGGRRVQGPGGLGTVYDEPPEMKAKARWHEGRFEDPEREVAMAWRSTLNAAPEAIEQFLGNSATQFTFRDLAAVKAFADRLIDADGSRFRTLKSTLGALGIGAREQAEIVHRWKEAGGPRLRNFAPYTAHVMSVDLFRTLAMASGHIDANKTSNYADIAYLYYLPFCEIFISTDKLHRRSAPLFMSDRQSFVWGPELRTELTELVAEYLADPELDDVGLMGVAGRKTFDDTSYIGALHMRIREDKRLARSPTPKLTPEAEKALLNHLKSFTEGPPPSPEADLGVEDESTTFERKVPAFRGRFPTIPKSARNRTTKS